MKFNRHRSIMNTLTWMNEIKQVLLRLTFILLSVITHEASAQEIREIEFSVYSQYPIRGVEYNPIDPTLIAEGIAKEPSLNIETHSLARMGPYKYKGGTTVKFIDTVKQSTVANVSVSKHSDKWLFIFARNPRYKKDPENQLQYLIYPFDDSRANLPANKLVFINISGKIIDGLLVDKRIKVYLGVSDPYEVQQSLPMNLWTRDFRGERLLPALIKTYKIQSNHRYIMIFFPPALRGSCDLDVRFIAEYVGVDP